MLKLMNIVISIVLVCFLSACASMNNTAKTEEQNQKVKTAKINAQLGIAYLERHNLQRSKQKLLLALEQAPNIPETWYSMAYFLEATGNKDDASIYYQKAVSIAPKRGDAQNNYGTFLCRSGDYRGAVEHFMLAVKDPTYLDPADAYENAGLCALKIPDKTMATKYFAQALQQDPSRTVSERKLRELNKYLAMNKAGEDQAGEDQEDKLEVATAESADDPLLPAKPITRPVVAALQPKRIAYHSLKQRHQEEENEDDPNSGLVKVPDLLARPAVKRVASAQQVSPKVLAEAEPVQAMTAPEEASPLPAPAELATEQRVATAQQAAVKTPAPAKAVYLPAKRKAKAKTVTAHAKSVMKTKKVAFVNPLTKEKTYEFHVEHVELKPLPKKKMAFKTRHAKVAKLTTKKHKSLASAKRHAKVKVARATVKRQAPARDVVTI